MFLPEAIGRSPYELLTSTQTETSSHLLRICLNHQSIHLDEENFKGSFFSSLSNIIWSIAESILLPVRLSNLRTDCVRGGEGGFQSPAAQITYFT